MSVWFPDEIDEWFGGDMDEAREHMAYERQEATYETPDLSVRPTFEDDDYEAEQDDDREPSADQEKAWDEQYDGTSLGA